MNIMHAIHTRNRLIVSPLHTQNSKRALAYLTYRFLSPIGSWRAANFDASIHGGLKYVGTLYAV
jgi:hypothetical protein